MILGELKGGRQGQAGGVGPGSAANRALEKIPSAGSGFAHAGRLLQSTLKCKLRFSIRFEVNFDAKKTARPQPCVPATEAGVEPGMRSPVGSSGQRDTAQCPPPPPPSRGNPPPGGAARRGRGTSSLCMKDKPCSHPGSCRRVSCREEEGRGRLWRQDERSELLQSSSM